MTFHDHAHHVQVVEEAVIVRTIFRATRDCVSRVRNVLMFYTYRENSVSQPSSISEELPKHKERET